jgi:hypothetical protein
MKCRDECGFYVAGVGIYGSDSSLYQFGCSHILHEIAKSMTQKYVSDHIRDQQTAKASVRAMIMPHPTEVVLPTAGLEAVQSYVLAWIKHDYCILT